MLRVGSAHRYGEVGRRLVNATEGVNRDEATNPYWGWIAEYGGDWYQGAVKTGIGASIATPLLSFSAARRSSLMFQGLAHPDLLEQTLHDSPISPSRLADLARVFEKATELEIAFWDAAIEAGKNKTREEVLDPKRGMPQ